MEKKNSELASLLPALAFILVGIGAHMVPLSAIWGGAGKSFTLFDLFAVIPVAYIGLIPGLIAIVCAKLGATVFLGMPIEPMTFLRLLPPVLAGAFFYSYATQKKFNGLFAAPEKATMLEAAIPLGAMAAFNLHPAILGTGAMVYSSLWLIPIAASFAPRNLFLRSLGATFVQHSVGSVLFLYTIPELQNPGVWLNLIPLVLVERGIFALGISVSYIGVQFFLDMSHTLYARINAQKAHAPLRQKKGKGE